jgi:hypothetical protein
MSNFGERLEAFLASTRFEAAVSAFLGAHIESLTFTEADGEQDVVSYSCAAPCPTVTSSITACTSDRNNAGLLV